MRFRHFLSLVAIVVPLSLTAAAPAHADDVGTLTPGKLIAGVDANNKPYSYIDNGTMTGFDVELLRAIAAKLGLSADFRAQDFSGLLPSVANQQIDLAAGSISITKDRLKMVDFSEGYLTGLLSVATLPDSPISSDPASVKGKRIGVVQGTIEDTYSDSYLPGALIVRFPNLNAGFLSLRSKYIDGYFVDKTLVAGLQSKYPQLSIADKLDISAVNLPAGFPVHKGNAKLEAALNRTLDQLVADGTWLKLYEKFHPGYPKPTSLPPYAMKTGS
ncbi:MULTISPECIES: ABC transporter substrate-binding protein [Paraburkholderia]|uniref:Polar amino acid transport system substrate-binding protein n=2 Tax=Paraburkholderia TaxID=1822464 RepID=A0A7Z0B672_9BURK|nr:transporter substrate-binding domain-containing protein [Paraburkholderia bryophila]NYH19177.1 polar amino acid transport system substrate-binding protein [Paraburkholderia bryophila]NYH21858.1 polar amino acid transport system substrate-binding protein [Paraburkholderia bryophila]